MEDVSALVAALDALLPQTQCTRCGFDGCRPYAEALALGSTAVNRCPPGGEATIRRLADRLGRPALPLDPDCGVERQPLIAWIDAQRCIGCARCLPPCPTDAILGAQRLLHTIIPELCTGCELCVPACPVDCIRMIGIGHTLTGWDAWSAAEADAARQRHDFRRLRLERAQRENDERLAAKSRSATAATSNRPPATDASAPPSKRALIDAALARAKAARAA